MIKKYVLYILVLSFVFCFSQSVKAEKSEKAESGLVGWWKFDEGAGDILHDSSGNGNDGKIYGAKWVKGKTSSALLFDGTKDNYVNCGNDISLQIDGPLTVSTWVRVPEVCKGHTYAVSKARWMVGIMGDNYPFFESKDSSDDEWIEIQSKKVAGIDEWVHIVAMYDTKKKKMEIYLNGKLSSEQERTDGAIGGVQIYPFMFGKQGLWSEAGYVGLISETKIYDRALSSEEIKNNYELESKTKDPSLSAISSSEKK